MMNASCTSLSGGVGAVGCLVGAGTSTTDGSRSAAAGSNVAKALALEAKGGGGGERLTSETAAIEE